LPSSYEQDIGAEPKKAAKKVDFEARAIQEYLDFQPMAAIYDRALIARAAEGRLSR
jgi:hypothetical protein